MKRYVFVEWLAVAGVALLAACLSEDAFPLDDGPDDIAEQQSAIGSSCTGAELLFADPVAPVCAGPWRYRWSTHENQSPKCGDKECLENNWATCPDWANATQTSETPPLIKKAFVGNCTVSSTGELIPPCSPPTSTATTWCNNLRNQRRDFWRAQIPPALWWKISTVLINGTGVLMPNKQFYQYTCQFKVNYPVAPKKRDASCNCAVALQHPSCDFPAEWRYSEPGLPLNQALGAHGLAADSEYTPEDDSPRCTTGEGKANPTPGATPSLKRTQVQSKYSFIDGYEAQVTAASKPFLRKNKKLIYELWGEYLTKAQRANARSLYKAAPTANHACGIHFAPPEIPAACTDPEQPERLAELLRCQRLIENNLVTAANISLEIHTCTKLLESFAELGETPQHDLACEGETHRTAARDALVALLDRNFDMIATGAIDLGLGAQVDLGALARQLHLIDAWYAQDERNEYFHGDGRVLEQHLSFVMGRFWNSARLGAKFAGTITTCGASATAECLAAGATKEQVEDAVGIAVSRARILGQGIVTALFTTPSDPIVIEPAADGFPAVTVTLDRPPLRGLPLLMLLGDTLTPLVNDMEGLVPYHDMACQFRNCRTSATDTPSRRLWRILASLEDPTVLSNAVATTKPLGGWQAAFKTLSDNHAFLANELSAAVGGGKFIDASLGSVPLPVRSLWLLLTRAEAAHARFEATGQFSAAASNVMYTSLLEQDRVSVIQGVTAKLGILNGTVATYKADLKSLVGQQLNAMQQGTSMDRLQTQWKNLAHSIDERQKAIDTLRGSRQAEDEAQGAMLSKIEYLKDQFDQNAFLPEGNSEVFEISATSAEFEDEDGDAPSEFAFKTIKNVPGGRMLQVSASGLWLPTCSLREQKFTRPDGVSLAEVDLTNAPIGPEGYSLRFDGSHYSAYTDTHTESNNVTVGVSGKVCASGGLGLGTNHVRAEACVYADTNHAESWSESWPTGDNSQVSASFNGGMRLDNTPYPALPAGALLVVVTDKDSNTARNAYVVYTTGTSILIDKPSDVYYVVNDKKCIDADPSRRLTVSSRIMVGADIAANAAIAAMKSLIAETCVGDVCTPGYFVGKRKEFENQGSLLPLQATTMHGDARQALRAAIGSTPLEQYPPALLELFDNFVNHEILKVDREIQINNLTNAQTRDKEERNAMARELAAGVGKSRLYNLLPQWTLQDLDGSTLAVDLDRVLVATRDYLRPLLDLWYPHALESLSFGPSIDPLLDADIDASLATIATSASQFVNILLDAYDGAQLGYKPPFQQLPVLVVSIPRPGHAPTEPDWRQVDETRAQMIWDAIDNKKLGQFTITPEDVYSLGQGQGVLGCFEATPVVKTVGVFVVRENGSASNPTLNGLGRKFQAYGSTTQPYATAQGPRVYQIGNGAWQKFDVLWRYGESGSQALTDFYQTPRTVRPVGLSPFGTFEIDFRVLSGMTHTGLEVNNFAPATEIVLLLEVDSRGIGSAVSGIKRCLSPAP